MLPNIKIFSWALLSLLLCFSTYTLAENLESKASKFSDYLALSKKIELSKNPYWYLLLRLYSGNRSEIQDANFFLSVDNTKNDFVVNPEKELTAFLKALLNSPSNEAHPLCKFPLRSRWIINSLAIPSDYFSSVQCEQLERFMQSFRHDKFSVLFMDERINTVMNMMGHIGIKLYSTDSSMQDRVISYITILHSFNPAKMFYDALIDGGEGQLNLYNFSYIRSFYLQQENRSMWQYDARITASQGEKILWQLWELKGRKGRYTYLAYNCVNPLIDLMRVADDSLNQTFLKKHKNRVKYWYSPLEYIQFLATEGYLKNANQPKVYLSEEGEKIVNVTGKKVAEKKIRHILDKKATSRFAMGLGYEQAKKEQPSHTLLTASFDLHGSFLGDNHLTEFTEYELRILSFDASLNTQDNSISFDEVNLYAVKYLPQISLNVASLSWQAKLGGNQFYKGDKGNKANSLFAPNGLLGVGLSHYFQGKILIWGLLNARYIHPNNSDNALLWNNELGVSLPHNVAREEFKSTFYYWNYLNDVSWILPRFRWVLNWKINTAYELNLTTSMMMNNRQKKSEDADFSNLRSVLSLAYYF
jgi:hypothetical protein